MKRTFSLWNRFRGVFSNLGEHPSYDWYFSLSCLGILSVAAIVLSGLIYYALALRPVSLSDDFVPTSVAVLDKATLVQALDDMTAADASAAIIPGPVLADPSRR
ncbi:MAG: hypothetical protein Q8L64_06880 [bacterium]|nr:hypothetical protein [bacterium]